MPSHRHLAGLSGQPNTFPVLGEMAMSQQGRAEEHLQCVRLKVLRRKPSVYVLRGLILGYAVALLDLAFEFLTAALPPKADIRQRIEHVCFVPEADVS
jgi:hypothetical protein